ncbi:MAG TPA: O-methyltransferase [Steroidobacteraceae bacterium]
MNQDRWNAVDAYFERELLPPDAALSAALAASAKAGLPNIQVSPSQGKLLQLLALSIGARRILEVGTLGGYSTIWMARALPAGGKLVTLELSALHARVALENFSRAGLAERIEVREGEALGSLARLRAERVEPFDLIFIDADKPNIPAYLESSLALSRVGTLIVVDNVVREGKVVDPSGDTSVQGVRGMTAMLARETRVTATVIQTVGVKGYDGFLLARVLSTA